MTLIATYVSPQGVIHAADSNLSSQGALAGVGPKVFRIPQLNGGLCFAGSYAVGPVAIDRWMPDFINRMESTGCASLEDFSERLRTELEAGMSNQRPAAILVQVAGFARDTTGTGFHPELHFIRNIPGVGINPDGTYMAAERVFRRTEDYFSAHPGGTIMYFNGYPSGRIGYLAATQELGRFFEQMWATPSLRFRPPSNLDEQGIYVGLTMTVVRELFAMSGQTVVGGPIQQIAVSPL